MNEEVLAHWGLLRQIKKKCLDVFIFEIVSTSIFQLNYAVLFASSVLYEFINGLLFPTLLNYCVKFIWRNYVLLYLV